MLAIRKQGLRCRYTTGARTRPRFAGVARSYKKHRAGAWRDTAQLAEIDAPPRTH